MIGARAGSRDLGVLEAARAVRDSREVADMLGGDDDVVVAARVSRLFARA